MGRNRSYDEDAALNGAMHAFRRSGYQAASIRDLEEATGLKAGSIYNSFGDKAGLFDAAFEHYNRTVLLGRIGKYAPREAGLDGLRDLFLSLLSEPRGEAFGCLITNTAVELGGEPPIHRRVEEGLRILMRTFVERVAVAQGADEKAHRTSLKLLALYQGILVLVRAGHDKTALQQLIDDEFDDLEKSHAS
jgi:AcrR family transcriptional regulator